jgi:MYXO-CTERM domain-containing protein
MGKTTIFILAALMAVAPATAQNATNAVEVNTTNETMNSAAAVPGTATAPANGLAPAPAEPAAAPTTAPNTADQTAGSDGRRNRDSRIPWGLVGLVGLVGLLGRRRRAEG